MNLQQTKLGLVLNYASLPLKLDTFDDRLVLQKAAYLLQEAGVDLGYRFRWYLRGPYSPGLTEDAFFLTSLSDGGEEQLKEWELDESSTRRIDLVKNLFAQKGADVLPSHLELLASTLFLIKSRQVSPDNPREISVVLQRNGKPFKEKEVSRALKDLKDYGYAIS